MSDLKQKYYESLREQAAESVQQAKRAAYSTDMTIWDIGHGRYIAMPVGPCVPPGSQRIATRRFAGDPWRVSREVGE